MKSTHHCRGVVAATEKRSMRVVGLMRRPDVRRALAGAGLRGRGRGEVRDGRQVPGCEFRGGFTSLPEFKDFGHFLGFGAC